MVVEQNPQIPDRTANMVYGMKRILLLQCFSTCKRLESRRCRCYLLSLINTAHAFVKNILGTFEYSNTQYAHFYNKNIFLINLVGNIKVGLLAGTIQK